jgi:hypothetical protein
MNSVLTNVRTILNGCLLGFISFFVGYGIREICMCFLEISNAKIIGDYVCGFIAGYFGYLINIESYRKSKSKWLTFLHIFSTWFTIYIVMNYGYDIMTHIIFELIFGY